MYHGTTPEFDVATTSEQEQRPTIALMGEFSAGKTTLINFLLGDDILPTRVTATQLPPVWMSFGERSAYYVDDDGNDHPVALEDLGEVGVDGVRYIRLFADTGILSELDLIDTPGISDPNIPIHFRDFVAEKSDALLWCTHSTQAWRESERSALDSMPIELLKHSVLLATRSDKLLPEDRARVHERLVRETDGRFANIIMFSATDAIEACASGEAGDLWRTSGGEELLDTLHHLSVVASDPDAPRREPEPAAADEAGDVLILGSPVVPGAADEPPAATPIVPRRVRRMETARPADAYEGEQDREPLAAKHDEVEDQDQVAELEPETAELLVEEFAPNDLSADEFETSEEEPVAVEAEAEDTAGLEEDEQEDDPDADEAALDEDGSGDLIAAVSFLAAEGTPGDDIEPELQSDEIEDISEDLDDPVSEDSEEEFFDLIEADDVIEGELVSEEEPSDFSNILNQIRENATDAVAEEEPLSIEDAANEAESGLVAAWHAYRAEHAPETLEDLDALITGFLDGLGEEVTEAEPEADSPEQDGWRLYV